MHFVASVELFQWHNCWCMSNMHNPYAASNNKEISGCCQCLTNTETRLTYVDLAIYAEHANMEDRTHWLDVWTKHPVIWNTVALSCLMTAGGAMTAGWGHSICWGCWYHVVNRLWTLLLTRASVSDAYGYTTLQLWGKCTKEQTSTSIYKLVLD